LKQLQLEEIGMESRVKEMDEHVEQMKAQMKLSEEAFKSAQEASNKTNRMLHPCKDPPQH